jgi:protein-tyrosine phosphatase
MAEELLKFELPECVVRSAGIGAMTGKGADPLAIQLMKEKGLDITAHRAQQVSLSLIAQSELVLVMDLEQKRFIETRYPGARGKVFRIAEEAKADVPDPYQEGIDNFRSALRLIDDGVKFWVEQIKRMG